MSPENPVSRTFSHVVFICDMDRRRHSYLLETGCFYGKISVELSVGDKTFFRWENAGETVQAFKETWGNLCLSLNTCNYKGLIKCNAYHKQFELLLSDGTPLIAEKGQKLPPAIDPTLYFMIFSYRENWDQWTKETLAHFCFMYIIIRSSLFKCDDVICTSPCIQSIRKFPRVQRQLKLRVKRVTNSPRIQNFPFFVEIGLYYCTYLEVGEPLPAKSNLRNLGKV
jgi:hypothetical protein